jgi:hypothetical protein
LRGFPFAAKFESRLKKQRSALLHKVVKESQWELIAPSLPASPGIQDDRRPTTGTSAKPCSGLPARVHHLESCLPALPPLDFKGGFESLFEDLYGDPDFEYAIIDGTIVRVRQHGIGAKGARKIRPLASGPKNAWPGHQDRRNVTRFGNLAGFVLPPGERYASAGVAPWIEKIACSAHRHGLRK